MERSHRRTRSIGIAVIAIVATGCSSWPPSVVANRGKPERWHLLALPGAGGQESMVSDLLAAHDEVWIAEGSGTVARLDRDGHRTEVARLAGDGLSPRLLPQPTGIAAVTGLPGSEGVRVTMLAADGRTLSATEVHDLAPATLMPLYADYGRNTGRVVLFGQRGYMQSSTEDVGREACVLVELDARGTVVRRRVLGSGGAPHGYGCRPAGVAVVGVDLIVGVTTDSAVPGLGLTSHPEAPPIGVIARLGPDGAIKWHRELAIADAQVQLSDLTIAGGTVAAVGTIEQDWGGPGYRIDFGPTPQQVPGSEYNEQPRQRVVAVGLDPETGASRWLRLIEGHGDVAFLADALWLAGAGDGLAIAVQPMNDGSVEGETMREHDVYITGLDGGTGRRGWSRVARADRRGSLDGIEVGRIVMSDSGAVHLVGGFRRRFTVGAARAEGRFDVIEPCKGGQPFIPLSQGAGDRWLFASLPPPDPCQPQYVEPLTGFVARITR